MMFKDELRRLRQEKGLSRRALGEASDVSPRTIEKYEQGVIEPSFKSIDKLAKGLDIDSGQLIKTLRRYEDYKRFIVDEHLEGMVEDTTKYPKDYFDNLIALVQSTEDYSETHTDEELQQLAQQEDAFFSALINLLNSVNPNTGSSVENQESVERIHEAVNTMLELLSES